MIEHINCTSTCNPLRSKNSAALKIPTFVRLTETTVEIWTKRGLVTYSLLFVMQVASRRVHCAGLTISPNEAWIKQIGRNMTDPPLATPPTLPLSTNP